MNARPAHARPPHALRLAAVLMVTAISTAIAGACARADVRGRPSSALDVVVRTGSIVAPDTITAGWSRFRVTEDGDGHIVVLFRLSDSARAIGMPAVIAALDSAPATPAFLAAMGGPEVGDSGEVTIQLSPGDYLLACVTRGADGHRHLAAHETRPVTVGVPGNDSPRSPPRATVDVDMRDFAYVGADTWPAGRQTLHVRNEGAQDHQLRIVRLNDGATLGSWVAGEGKDGRAIAGVARLAAGRSAFLMVDLPPGTYVLSCLVTDPASGRMHVELGMLREVHVR